MKVLDRGVCSWNLGWRRNLFVWEENIFNELLSLVNTVAFSNEIDVWAWGPENGGVFTVNSTYRFLDSMTDTDLQFSPTEEGVFRFLWKSKTPSKVTAFVWQLLLDRIPTRYNLQRRGVVLADLNSGCVLCDAVEETSIHLFLHCSFTSKVWRGGCSLVAFSLFIVVACTDSGSSKLC
ncbi:hypothetical protein A2U01_0016944, partial [Trifolium medium]|nr:hypothetical protein [Trifolium medium]